MTECWSEKAKDGTNILHIKRNGISWRLNSPYSPKKEAERWAEQYLIQGRNVPVFLFGLGNGYFLRALLEKAKEDTLFLVVEPEQEVFEQIEEEYKIKDLLREHRIILLLGNEKNRFLEMFFSLVDEKNKSQILCCVHPWYDEIYPEEYRDYLKMIHDCQIQIESVIATVAFHGTKRAENMLTALSLLSENAVLTYPPREIARQIPAIIVAAGPSLDQNIEELKKAQGKAILVAVDRAAAILYDHGIDPDMTITLDPVKESKYLDERVKTPLLCNFASNRDTMKQHQGRLIFYGAMGYAKWVLEKINRVVPGWATGGSVATAAFHICATIGIKTIILVGQDLAFKDGKSHAAGQSGGRERKHYQVEGIDGNLIETRADWYIFLRWFEQTIRRNPQIRVIDATEGGAKIEGSELKTLSQILEELPRMPVTSKEFLEYIQYRLSKEEEILLKEKLEEDWKDLDEIVSLTEKGIKATKQLIKACKNKSIDKPEYGKQIKILKELNEELKKHEILSLLEYYEGREAQAVLAGVYQMGEDDLKNKEITYQRAKLFYEMYQRNSKKLSEEMQKVLFSET